MSYEHDPATDEEENDQRYNNLFLLTAGLFACAKQKIDQLEARLENQETQSNDKQKENNNGKEENQTEH